MLSKKRQILGIFLALFVAIGSLTPQAQSYYYLPEEQKFTVGDSLNFILNFPPALLKTINVYIKDGEKLLNFQSGLIQKGTYSLGVDAPILVNPGKVKLELKLFGFIPLKEINVDVLPQIQVIPGGHSIGVLLRTEGVMVVGYSPILNEKNEPVFPARDADIAVGDVILEVNGIKTITDEQVREIIASWEDQTKGIPITVKREDKIYQRIVYPHYCQDTQSYRIGLFVRDNAGGIGTLTFYEPESKKYGALGHVITDGETNQRIAIRQGKILAAAVEDIERAQRGMPGEKVGIFQENSDIGNIEKNEKCGIYGTAIKEITNPLYKEPMPIAYGAQIKPGAAEILTVVNGKEIQKYSINIERVLYGRTDGKNMIIRITDPDLLEKTGGIVQGMSGSPIIQNGRLVGAVTHVFVNDPIRGYGVFIESMLIEAGVLQNHQQTLGISSQGLFIFGNKTKVQAFVLLFLFFFI